MNVLLDTNTVSYAIRGHDAVLRRLTAQPMETLAISSITAAEFLHGLARRPEATKLHALAHEFLLRVEVLPWERVVAERYAQARATMEKRGIPIVNRFSGKRGAFPGFAVKARRPVIAVSMARRCNADGGHRKRASRRKIYSRWV